MCIDLQVYTYILPSYFHVLVCTYFVLSVHIIEIERFFVRCVCSGSPHIRVFGRRRRATGGLILRAERATFSHDRISWKGCAQVQDRRYGQVNAFSYFRYAYHVCITYTRCLVTHTFRLTEVFNYLLVPIRTCTVLNWLLPMPSSSCGLCTGCVTVPAAVHVPIVKIFRCYRPGSEQMGTIPDWRTVYVS